MIEAVIFDFGRTLYDPVNKELFPGSIQVLNHLTQSGIRLSLVTIAVDYEARRDELVRFGIDKFFSTTKILGLREPKEFSGVIKELGTSPANVAAVGDNLKREITEANRLGAYPIWTRQRLAGSYTPRSADQTPKAIIESIQELVPLIDRLNS